MEGDLIYGKSSLSPLFQRGDILAVPRLRKLMGLFSKPKKLIDYELSELDLDMLSHLQASLMAKLILVNKELIARHRKLGVLAAGLTGAEDSRQVLLKAVARFEQLNAYLESELSQIAGRDK
jgi:hypothetical protein